MHSTKVTKPDLCSSPPNGPPTPVSQLTKDREAKDRELPEVLKLFDRIRSGRYEDLPPWKIFKLRPGEYEEIGRQLTLRRNRRLRGFVEDKIRYDYWRDSNRLILRRPTPIHEVFLARVDRQIGDQLSTICQGTGKAASFAKLIENYGSSDLFEVLPPGDTRKPSKHSPDSSWILAEPDARNKYPQVVLEVSYSQKTKNLDQLALDYFTQTKGGIQVVVGLDIDYIPPKSAAHTTATRMATTTVWRLKKNSNGKWVPYKDIDNEVFRDGDGQPTDAQGLRLRLSDFISLKTPVSDILGNENPEIVISAQELCKHLDKAEELYNSRTRGHPPDDLLDIDLPEIFSSEDQESTDDEADQEGEAHNNKRALDEDPGYQGRLPGEPLPKRAKSEQIRKPTDHGRDGP